MTKIDRTNIATHLLEYQFSLINKTIQQAEQDEAWIVKWTLTPQQQEELTTYAIPLIKKVFKCNKSRAQTTLNWFRKDFGLGTF